MKKFIIVLLLTAVAIFLTTTAKANPNDPPYADFRYNEKNVVLNGMTYEILGLVKYDDYFRIDTKCGKIIRGDRRSISVKNLNNIYSWESYNISGKSR